MQQTAQGLPTSLPEARRRPPTYAGIPRRWSGAVTAALDHAASEPELETVGVIVGAEYVPLSNRSLATPCSFRAEHIGPYDAVVHSHPGRNPQAYPSVPDMRQQVATAVPWIILPHCGDPFAWGLELEERAELVGRSYRWGVHDCFSVVRDWYGRNGIQFADVPRAWGCWRQGDPFGEHFEAAGFRQVDIDQPRRGDGLLFALRNPTVNHCAVYVGGGRMLHHPGAGSPVDPTELSRVESATRWRRYLRGIIRHVG